MPRTIRISPLGDAIEISHATFPGCNTRVNRDAYLVFPLTERTSSRMAAMDAACVAILADDGTREARAAEESQASSTLSAQAVNAMYAAINHVAPAQLDATISPALEYIRAGQWVTDHPPSLVPPSPLPMMTAALYKGRFMLAYAGNNCAYLIRNGNVHQLTLGETRTCAPDTSVVCLDEPDASRALEPSRPMLPANAVAHRQHGDDVQRLIFDATHRQEAAFYPQSGVLVESLSLRIDDLLLLCTNGLTDVIDDAEIQTVATMYPAHEIAQRLISLVGERAGADSATALVLHWRGHRQRRSLPWLTHRMKMVGVLALIVTSLFGFGLSGHFTGLVSSLSPLWRVNNSYAQAAATIIDQPIPASEVNAVAPPRVEELTVVDQAPTAPAASGETDIRPKSIPTAPLTSTLSTTLQSDLSGLPSGQATTLPITLTAAMSLSVEGIERPSQSQRALAPLPVTRLFAVDDIEIYSIQPGDNLWDLAWEYGIAVEDLLAANPRITKETVLRVGQKIVMPRSGFAPTSRSP